MKKLLISSVILFAFFLIPGLTLAQWQQTNGPPYGGSVYCLANNGTSLFAGTYGGGVFLSTNNGTNWTAVNSGLTNKYVYCLAVSGSNLYAGTNGRGVFLSTNNGTSWNAVNTGLTYTYTSVLALAVYGANLFAGTGDGVFLSTNNGTSWNAMNSGLTNTTIYALAVSGTNLFAGTYGGVFLSTDNGASWNAVNSGLTNLYVRCLTVIGSNLFAGTDGGVFLSTDNGTSWNAVNTGMAHNTVYALAVSGTNLFAGTGYGIFLSTNNGTNWNVMNSGLTSLSVYAIAVSGTDIFAGTAYVGVFLSTNNGTSWNAVNSGLTCSYVYAFAVSPNGAGGTNLFAGVYGGGVFLSTNNGTSWNAMNSGLTSLYVNCLTVLGSNLFAGTSGGGVFLSTNNGTSWNAVNSGLTSTSVFALAVSGSNLFAGTSGGGVFLSTNSGTSWNAVNSGLTNKTVYALAVSGTTLFAGTWGGGVFLSTNSGTSWTAVNSGITNMYVYSLAVSPNGAGDTNLFAGTSGGVFLSTNNGTSWTAMNSGLTNIYVHCLTVIGSNLFAGTWGGGVFLSTNSGTSWTAVNSGLTNKTVYALAVGGTTLFAGTYGGGVWHLPLSTIPQERIVNGNFEAGTDSWTLQALGTASGTFDIDNTNPIEGIGSARVTINASDSTDWHLQFQQVFGALSKDKRYYIKFRARASKAVQIDTWITQNHDSYSIIFLKHVSLNTVTQTFVDSVDIYEDDSNVKLTFVLGTLNNGDEVWFDEVSVVQSEIHEDTTQVLTINVVGQEKIINGKFENGMNPWELELNNGGNAKYDLETSNPIEGKASAHVTITNSTGTDWHVQFKQALKVLKGRKYYMLYQARASQGATILAGIQQYHSPYSFLSQKIVRLTTKTITVLDTTAFLDEDDDSVKVTFLLGNIGNVEVWFDNITVIEYTPVEPLKIAIDAEKDQWYDGLLNPDNGLIYLPARSYLNERPFTAPHNDNDISAAIWTAWDTTYLYYYAKIKDDRVLVNNPTVFQNDGIEVKYDPDPAIIGTSGALQTRITAYDSADAQLAAGVDNINGDRELEDINGTVWKPSSADYARKKTSDGYVLEWRVPLTYLNKGNRHLRAGVGGVLGTAINVVDNDSTQRDHVLQWSAGHTDSVWSNPKLHGKVTFLAANKLKYEAVSGQDPGIINDSAAAWYYKSTTAIKPFQLTGVPESFELMQNYPNPFNPTTTIDYSLPEETKVKIEIFNILGKKMTTLVNKIEPAGNKKVSWNAHNFASGVYYYRITAGKFIKTRKMLVMK